MQGTGQQAAVASRRRVYSSGMDATVAVPSSSSVRRQVSLGALVASNLLPLVGVLYWGWDVGALVVLYWSENLILGAFTLLKMIAHAPLGGLLTGCFFVVHYGGFCAVHGVFVLVLAVGDPGGFDLLEGEPWPLWLVFVQLLIEVVRHVLSIAPPEWLIAFAALALSHGVSLAMNYFRGGEYHEQNVKSLMMAPYKRIVVLHVAILGGGFGVMALGSPLPLLILLVMLKLALDVWLHLREHRPATVPEPAGV